MSDRLLTLPTGANSFNDIFGSGGSAVAAGGTLGAEGLPMITPVAPPPPVAPPTIIPPAPPAPPAPTPDDPPPPILTAPLDVTPPAVMPTQTSTSASAPVAAAGNKATGTIAARSGRKSTVLTKAVKRTTRSQQSPDGDDTIAGASLYSRRTLG